MFCIDPSPTFVAEVPLSKPGLLAPIAIQVTFHHKNRLQVAAWILKASKAEAGDDGDALLQLLLEVIADWKDLLDESGNQVPFSATNLAKLLTNFTPARGELFEAYVTELTEAKRKN